MVKQQKKAVTDIPTNIGRNDQPAPGGSHTWGTTEVQIYACQADIAA